MRIIFSLLSLILVVGFIVWWATDGVSKGLYVADTPVTPSDAAKSLTAPIEEALNIKNLVEQRGQDSFVTEDTAAGGGTEFVKTDMVIEGAVAFNGPDTALLLYNMSEGEADNIKLLFDHKSICVFGEGSNFCTALNVGLEVSLDNKDVVVEGVKRPSGLLVRKIRTVDVLDDSSLPPAGRAYVTWGEANAEWVATCKVQSIRFLPYLDVELLLKDASKVYAVLSTKAAAGKDIETAMNTCGTIAVEDPS